MIYFIQSGSSRYVKIGYCVGDPKLRMGQLQVGNPEPLRLLSVKDGDAKREALIHQMFAHLRVRGEWFEFNDEVRDFAKPLLRDADEERKLRAERIRDLVAMPPDAYEQLMSPRGRIARLNDA